MIIRNYVPSDERKWLNCRAISFLSSSYYNDVLTKKENYENETVSLVAEEDNKIDGLIEIEIEQSVGNLCVAGNQRGAVIWHLAVLPEYRRKKLASLLWSEAQKSLISKGVLYCEVWTQEDIPANSWYLSKGFANIERHNWLRCYARSSRIDWFLNKENVGNIYGVEEMIFEAPTQRRDELLKYCYRIDEVRLYSKNL